MEESNPELNQWDKDNFKQLCIPIGKSKNHTLQTIFEKDALPIRQKVPDPPTRRK